MRALGSLAAPPCRDVRQGERFPEQHFGNSRQEGEQRPRFEYPRAQRVDDGRVASSDGADETGGAEARAAFELQRIGIAGIEPPPEHADRTQPVDRPDHEAATLDGQVLTFNQHQTEIACDIRVLEIGLVQRPRRQDGRAAVGLETQSHQGIAKAAEKARQPVHVRRREALGKHPRGRHPVLEGKARTGRSLGPVPEDPPFSIGSPADLEGDEMQPMTRTRPDADQRSQPFRASGNDCGWQVAPGNEPVFAIEIRGDELEQIGTLPQSCGHLVPFGLFDQRPARG
jgi:hypothetical protein